MTLRRQVELTPMRRSSTWTPAAFVIGGLLFLIGNLNRSPQATKYGAICWFAALCLAGLAWFIHWQGWGD